MLTMDNIMPALRVAKAAVTGTPVPGLESAINAVLEVAEMVQTMKGNLEDLPGLAQKIRDLIKVDLQNCSTELKERLDKFRNNLGALTPRITALAAKSKLKQFWNSKKYEKEIADIKASIMSYMQEFIFSNEISVLKLLEKMSIKVDHIEESVQKLAPEVKQTNNSVQQMVPEVQDIHNTIRTQYVAQTLAKIRYVSARYNAPNTPDMCMDGTRTQILKDIITGLTVPSKPSERIVLLSGSAGTGKSTIAKSVASILAEEKHMLAASFFFSKNYAERREIDGLPLTLAYQLAHHSTEFKDVLLHFLNQDQHEILDADPKLQFRKLVVDLLAQIPASSNPWIICLDALDECGQDRGQVFLRWLSDNIAKIPTYVHFFLTGRPDVPSYLGHDDLCLIMHHICLDDVEPAVVEKDIRRYIAYSLDGSNWTPRNPWKPQAHEVDQVTELSAGLFIFAATAVRYVRTGSVVAGPLKSLKFLIEGAIPGDIHDLYFRIMNEGIVVPAKMDNLGKYVYDTSLCIVQAILGLLEPMDLTQLAAFLGFEETQVRNVLIPLSAVILLPESGKIRIIHLSFREFMTSQHDGSKLCCTRSDLLCCTEKQKQELTSKVFQTMLVELKFNICNLPTSHLKNTDMPEFEEKVDTCIPGYLRYCCYFWAEHLGTVSHNSENAEAGTKFLENKLLFWLEVLSLTERIPTALSILSKFMMWNKDTKMMKFAADAKHFITFFRPAISQSTPHLYVTALALAPMQSEIAITFRPMFSKLLSIQKGQMERWPATVGIIESYEAKVSCMAFSPDGKTLVTGSDNDTVRLWDAQSGAAITDPLCGHTNGVSSVAFSPDGKVVVSGSLDSTLRLWDAQTGALMGHPLQGHTKPVLSVAFSPDGKFFISSSRDKMIRRWDAQSRIQFGEPLQGHTHYVLTVAISPDSKLIASGSADRTIRIWSVHSGTVIGKALQGQNYFFSVAFSPDSKLIVAGSRDKTVQLWDVTSREMIGKPLCGHTASVQSVDFSPDGKLIVSGSYDFTVRLWYTQSRLPLGKALQDHTAIVNVVAFSPLGGKFASASCDHTVRLWDTSNIDPNILAPGEQSLVGHTQYIKAIAWSPDGKLITVCLWHAQTGAVVGMSHEGHTDAVTSVAWSSDGFFVASASIDNSVCLWKVQSIISGDTQTQTAYTCVGCSVAFSPDDKLLVTGSDDNIVRLWNRESGSLIHKLEGHTDWVTSVTFSPDLKLVASSSRDYTLRLWDVQTGLQAGEPLRGHTGWVKSVSFSPDGKLIASGSDDETVRVWDVQSRLPTRLLGGHRDGMESFLHLAANDHTAQVWFVESGILAAEPLHGHTRPVTCVHLSPDGQILATGSEDKTVRLWEPRSKTVIEEPSEKHCNSESFPVFAFPYKNNFIKPMDPVVFPSWSIQRDGWVLSGTDELLLWLPHNYRQGFWMPHTKFIIGVQQTKLSYQHFAHGTEWINCYVPLKQVSLYLQ
ncbi:WD40-repeat-containing domain protein [Roridomyces roridus]|uniref:WD40-repeat-containing domain protein n=1 Tax=Roridomyces roridus TaxID=1738132 RepID=A0AAD7FRY4_9AGAR|nr:WD40-repeat-containing domain protein [Roridomyces roridus]